MARMNPELGELVAAFEACDLARARAVCSALVGRAEAPEGIERVVDALWDAQARATGQTDGFAAVIKQLVRRVWVPQHELCAKLLERLLGTGRLYRKTREVNAIQARGGERIVSVTADGRETEKTAATGDYIVENRTGAKERYIVGADKFAERYRRVAALADGWSRYRPTGEVRALEVDTQLLTLLDRPEEFYIEAPWGEAQRVRVGDLLAAPPSGDEIYRIAAAEFRETYGAA
jgi:hypothetical protein